MKSGSLGLRIALDGKDDRLLLQTHVQAFIQCEHKFMSLIIEQ